MNPAPVSSPASTSAASWKQRYEALRQLAVAGSQLAGTEPLGLVLLVRQGVARWMHSWPRPTPSAADTAAPPVPPPVLPTPQWQQQLTALLAQMSLAHLSPTAAL
jgi:hypothetical protein